MNRRTELNASCPHCGRETFVHAFCCDGYPVETHRCPEHGDVVPMRSAVVHGYAPPDWSAA